MAIHEGETEKEHDVGTALPSCVIFPLRYGGLRDL